MDEMNNMNEVTTEETSNEMTPVVTENNEVKTEENSGINTWAGIAAAVGVLTIGAIGAGMAHPAQASLPLSTSYRSCLLDIIRPLMRRCLVHPQMHLRWKHSKQTR